MNRKLMVSGLLTSSALVVGASIALDDLSAWQNVLEFEASDEVREVVATRGRRAGNGTWKIQKLADASGATLNCDYYPVRVTKLPFKVGTSGVRMTAEELLADVRQALVGKRDGFLPVDPTFARFRLLDEEVDGPLWNDSDSIGAVLFIDAYVPGLSGLGSPDTAAVIVSRSAANEFYFSTIQAGNRVTAGLSDDNAGAHPVAGTRCFGFFSTDGKTGYTFFTLGADRAWGVLDRETIVFNGMDKTWASFQSRLVDHINNSGGEAHAVEAQRNRLPWEQAKSILSGK